MLHNPNPSHPIYRDDDDIEALAAEVQQAVVAHIPLSHLHWGLWGLIQAKQSSVDFDFEGYAAQRLEQFLYTARAVLVANDGTTT